MKALTILAGLALCATSAMASTTATQEAKLVSTQDLAVDGEIVKAKVFEFKAKAVGSCVFGRETVTVYRNGAYTDVVRANGECGYDEYRPVCNLKTVITVTDEFEERIKRWSWERNIDWSDASGGEPVEIEDKSKRLKKNYRDVTYVLRQMKCTRIVD